MLTETEKEWLKRREETLQELGSYYCPHCEDYKEEWDAWMGHCQKAHCRKLEERDISRKVWMDALRFEAKLNALLIKGEEIDVPCSHLPEDIACPYSSDWKTPCEWCNLKELRLIVEADMEGEDAG